MTRERLELRGPPARRRRVRPRSSPKRRDGLRGLPAGAEGPALRPCRRDCRARCDAFAEAYAREQYGRRGESVALWVVPRDSVLQIEEFVDELQRNYHRVDGYPLKEKLKEARASGNGLL